MTEPYEDKDTATNGEPATSEKAVVITIEVESGRIAQIKPINGASEPQEIREGEFTKSYRNFGAGFDTVCFVIRSHSSPGCLQIIGGTLQKVC